MVQGCTLDSPPLSFSSTLILRNPDQVNRIGLGIWIRLTREPLMEITVMVDNGVYPSPSLLRPPPTKLKARDQIPKSSV